MNKQWENRRIAVHGSTATPENPAEFKFQLFDYKTDTSNETPMHEHVNNGIDHGGPGVYCYAQKSGRAINKSVISSVDRFANHRLGKGGSVIGFSFPGFTDDGKVIPQMNDPKACPSNIIPAMEWGAVLEQVVNERRKLANFDLDHYLTVLNDLGERYIQTGIEPSEAELQPIADQIGENVEYLLMRPGQSRYQWEKSCLASICLNDPASKLCEEFGIQSVDATQDILASCVENIFDNYENLAELTMMLYIASAYENSARFSETFNHTFIKAMQDNVTRPELFQMSYSKNDKYHLIHDPRAITVECMVTTHYDVDEERFSGLIGDIKNIIPTMVERREYDAIAQKCSQLIQHHMGMIPSDELYKRFESYARHPESLIQQIRYDIADSRIVYWEREPGMMKRVLGITPPKETLHMKASATPLPKASAPQSINNPSLQPVDSPKVERPKMSM